MSVFENILYGFISGITEFLPVSSHAHQAILRFILGVNTRNFLQEFLVHIGLLLSILAGCREIIARLRREQKSVAVTRFRKKQLLDPKSYYDIRLLKTAAFPLVIGLAVSFATLKKSDNLMSIILFLILNAFILFIAEHTQHGNRDSRTMSGLDGIVMGILGGLSVFPGVSRTGIISAYTTVRGADYESTANWAVLLGIPALVIFLFVDIVGIITVGAGIISFTVLFGYILAGLSAFCGGYIAISIFRAILAHSGFSQFAYYSFGAAFLTFILYLIA